MADPKEYYGGFFWLAAISFIVPLFVGYRAFDKVSPKIRPEPDPDVSGVCNELWDYLLKNYVENGLVDYKGIKKENLFDVYLRELGSADPERLPSDEHRLALMCNAYNAFVINGVITHKYPAKVTEFSSGGKGFFDIKEHIFAGRTLSLNELEHEIIRPTFKEPRVHVALVCAARSCPAIRPEAYTGEQLEKQLQDQAELFANNETYVRWVADENRIELSPILKWYGEDWDEKFPNGGAIQWLTDLVDSEELKAKLQSAISGEIKTTYAVYDWTLNSQQDPGQSSGGGKTSGFGSGSIPDE